MIKSYRGLLAHGMEVTIPLHTTDGKTGYRIVKFEIMQPAPGTQDNESVVKVFKISQSTIDGTIDFSDATLLAAGNMVGATSGRYTQLSTIIFDKEIVNQDIYVTQFDADGNDGSCNYFIELEQVRLTEVEALVAIVKNLRNEQ